MGDNEDYDHLVKLLLLFQKGDHGIESLGQKGYQMALFRGLADTIKSLP